MDAFFASLFKQIAANSGAAGWILAAYLLARLHQVIDRQHKANLDMVSSLTVIHTVLVERLPGRKI